MRGWVASIFWCLFYVVLACVIAKWAITTQERTAELERERRRLQHEAARLRRDNARRVHAVRALHADPFLVERVLREQYGYRPPGQAVPGSPDWRNPPSRRPGSQYAIARSPRRSHPE
jgi:hypothetical protein